jgi:protein-disulfide isomerase
MSVNTCPLCGERSGSSSALRDHTWRAHSACHHCGEQFDDKETLYVHWLAVHDNELSRMDHKQAESEVGALTFGDRLAHQGPSAALGGLRRRRVLLAGGTAIAGGVAALGGVFGGSSDTNNDGTRGGESNGQTGAVAAAPILSNPDEYRYPTMGTADTDVTVTYFGSWKCPYCAQFSTGFLSTLVTEYVESEKITLEFRNLAYIDGKPFLGSDAPAAGHAGLAVWQTDPESYWAYHEYVLENQPPESKAWATADKLVSFARKAGVNEPSVVRTAVQEERYEEELRATTEAAEQAGVDGTPTLLIDGTTVSPFEEKQTRQRIEDAIA